MRNTVMRRNSLRSAHLKKLEETKAHLHEIKNKVVDSLIRNKTDLEMPTLEKLGSGKYKKTTVI